MRVIEFNFIDNIQLISVLICSLLDFAACVVGSRNTSAHSDSERRTIYQYATNECESMSHDFDREIMIDFESHLQLLHLVPITLGTTLVSTSLRVSTLP